jgi:hypothetical protein
MPFQAKIIEDSVSPQRIRLTTMELRYPRFIHAEVLTHRKFARNASSSRAIPVSKLIEDALGDPAMPIHWGRNQPGMQAREELIGLPREVTIASWLRARDAAVEQARLMVAHGAHKQIVNRILEPFTHIRVVVTATDWANFFALRRHPDAQPEIKRLADLMWIAMRSSEPTPLKPGEWHLPYVESHERQVLSLSNARKVSTARCARASYRLHDGSPSALDQDIRLYESLMEANPKHASPAEHQATPDRLIFGLPRLPLLWAKPRQHGPLHGWVQHRKTLAGEYINTYEDAA